METTQITSRFGASVRGFRHGMGISQEALAERADLHRTYLADIERGARNVTLKSIAKLARALQVPIPTLLSDTGRSPSRPKPSNGKSPSGKSKQARITNPLSSSRRALKNSPPLCRKWGCIGCCWTNRTKPENR